MMNKYKVSLSAVNIPDETYLMMEEALRAGKIGQTDLIEQFEDAIASYVRSKYCIAVSSGTMADAVAVAAMKVMRPEIKRVIVPALTFIAQPNSVRYNSLEVSFVDVNENWTIDLSRLPWVPEIDYLTFSTDLMGRCAMDGYFDIEDSCEAFGSMIWGKYAGTNARMGTYSFFPSHTISTGEGGAIVTIDDDLAKLCRSIRAHGSGSTDPMDKFHFPRFGFNARLSSLQAVLGIALMKHVKTYVEKRRAIYYLMRTRLGGFQEREEEFIVPHGYPVEFVAEEDRDNAMRNILKAGIECRKFFSCIPNEEPYYLSAGEFPVATHISHTHLYVPCHQNMSFEDASYVCDILEMQKGYIKKTVQ